MNIIDFLRILRRHIVLLVLIPIVLAAMVTYMTRKPELKFDSETTLYTGIATGSSVEMDKSINFMASNTSFDNLINVIKSRETQQEVSIRLLTQHLLLSKADPRYISAKNFAELKKITPAFIKRLVVKNSSSTNQKAQKDVPPIENVTDDTSAINKTFSFQTENDSIRPSWLPVSINQADFEQTVKNLTEYMQSSDTNFIYKLLNFSQPHYSIIAISTVKAQRIGISDLVSLKYETDDPAICQQTLEFLTQVCIKNYRSFKENRSDAVVKYFEFQLKQAAARLTVAEDKLLKFNTDNNIINYYEQSKAVAGVKEQLDLDFNSKKVHLAGVQAAIARLEEKLGNQEQIRLKSSKIIELRDQIGALSYKVASFENRDSLNYKEIQTLADSKAQSEKLKDEIKVAVGELYKYGNTTDGLPISSVLNDWIANVIEAENSKAGLVVMAQKIIEFQKQYAIYAPAGANLKRIEREISVAEQEFLEILHGLNLAKLKMQDNELSSNIKSIDPPYFPLTPNTTNRKILIVLAGFIGFILVLGSILVMEYFDNTLKSPNKASKILKLGFLGTLPKLLLKATKFNFPFITNRLLEIIVQNLEMSINKRKSGIDVKTVLVFSTQNQEGKTVVAGNMALELKEQGKKVLVLNYSPEHLQNTKKFHLKDVGTHGTDDPQEVMKRQRKTPFISLLLGYPDTRVDLNSPLLEDPTNYLGKEEYLVYKANLQFLAVKNYQEILDQNGYKLSFKPDFVFIELPPILYHPYPVHLVAESDLPVLVCRSNRTWSEADQAALEVLMKLTDQEPHFVLNGTELLVIESVLGELPRKRSWLRRKIKNILRFQFFTKNQL